MDGKGHSDEVSDRNEELITGNRRKSDLCSKVAKNLAALCLCSSALWKVELASNEAGHLTEANVEVWFSSSWLLTVKFKRREIT